MYNVIFKNGEKFEGGEPENSKWNEMPDLEISQLNYSLGTKWLILENYEAYNHLVEYITIVGQTKTIISKILILGKIKNYVHKFTYDFIKGRVKMEMVQYGKEYNNSSTTGWKKGLLNKRPKYNIK